MRLRDGVSGPASGAGRASLGIARLTRDYGRQRLTVGSVIDDVLRRVELSDDDGVWISRVDPSAVQARAAELQRLADGNPDAAGRMPLFGVPFAVKDSVDVAGLPTTAACPSFSYVPTESATVVRRLLDAGAVLVGKTNLDQFATGLTGARSPYGISSNPFDRRYIPGGSSSGSAVAVASGLVSFAIGSDAAGSGRVPAALNNLVGLKPTRGLVSTAGCVPACRTVDCLSVFGLTCSDAWRVLRVIAAYDDDDAYSRLDVVRDPVPLVSRGFRFGVLAEHDREFEGDADAADLYREAIVALERLGGVAVEIDFAPLREAAELLYESAWVADRVAPLETFLRAHADDLHPVTREVLLSAKEYSAVDAFRARDRLTGLKRRADHLWGSVDLLVVPTTPTTYTIEEVAAEPILLNQRLGRYTNFVNLLDFCALAVPNGFRSDGMPMGITLVGAAYDDATLATLGARFLQTRDVQLGGAQVGSIREDGECMPQPAADRIELAVFGAHLSGESLNHELVRVGARFVREARTCKGYRLFALPTSEDVPRPGLLRASDGEPGSTIAAEVWELSALAFGEFVAALKPPLSIGTVTLEDGRHVKGFLCESAAVSDARDITDFGGWRAYRQAAAG